MIEHIYLSQSQRTNGKVSQIKVNNQLDITQHILDVINDNVVTSGFFQTNLNNSTNLSNGDVFTIGIPNLSTDIKLVEFTLTADVIASGSIKLTPSFKNTIGTITSIPDININAVTSTFTYSSNMNFDITSGEKGLLKFTISSYSGGVDLNNVSITVRYITI